MKFLWHLPKLFLAAVICAVLSLPLMGWLVWHILKKQFPVLTAQVETAFQGGGVER